MESVHAKVSLRAFEATRQNIGAPSRADDLFRPVVWRGAGERSLHLIKKNPLWFVLCVCLFLSACVCRDNGIIEALGVSGAPEPGPATPRRAEPRWVGSGDRSVLFKRSSEKGNMNLEAIKGGRLSYCHPSSSTLTISAGLSDQP